MPQPLVPRRVPRVLGATLFLAALGACTDSTPPTAARGSPAASPSIADAANSGGNAHFYFLPPLVASPQYSGESDETHSPMVVVCEWKTENGGSCGPIVAQFGRGDGSASDHITYDATAEHYQVDWKTDECTDGPCALDATKTYRLRVLVGSYEIGHADLDVVSGGNELKNVQTGEYIGLVGGRTLPVKFRIERGAVSMVVPGTPAGIGVDGGVLATEDGMVTLQFPAGALAAEKAITVAPLTAELPGVGEWATPVDLGPDGTTFAEPVTLTLAFDGSKLPPGITPKDVAIYTWGGDSWVLVPGSTVNEADNTVSARISHFSTYWVSPYGFWRTGAPAPQTIYVGESVNLSGVVVAHDVRANTYCSTVRVRYRFLFWYRWKYWTNCVTVSESYRYVPVGLRIYWYAATDPWGPGAYGWKNVGAPWYYWYPADPAQVILPPGSPLGGFDTPGYGVVTRHPSDPTWGYVTAPPFRGAAAGSLVFFMRAGDQLHGGWPLFVIERVASVVVSPAASMLVPNGPGDTQQLAATLTDANGNVLTGRTVVWSSSNEAIARVDATGMVTAVAEGTATITATSEGKSGTATVTVGTPIYTLAFSSGSPEACCTHDIFIQNSDGSNRTNITNLPNSSEIRVRFSSDGKWMVFDSNRDGNGEVYLRDMAGSYEKNISQSAADDAGGSLDSFGKRIVFTSNRASGNYDLWIIDFSGDDPTPKRLTTDPLGDGTGAWSPDGRQIAFVRGSTATGYDVWVMDVGADGSVLGERQVTAIGGFTFAPRWSPDGTKLVFSREGTFIVDAKASRATFDTPGEIFRVSPASMRAEYPDWSPDGLKIVWSAWGEWNIYIANPDGSGMQRVPTPEPYQEAYPSFVPPISR